MAQENVELVRRIYDAGNRGDWNAAFRDASPNLEVTFMAGPNAGTHRGREEVQAVFDDLRSGFDLWITEPLEFFVTGDQVVAIVNNRLRPRGGTSGEFEFQNGHIWTVRDETVLSLMGFATADEALKAAGLSDG